MGSDKTKAKTVLISGTSSGIGYATAVLMAKEGWVVFAGVRKQKDYNHLRESHPNICPVFLDVTIPEQISKAMDVIKDKVGDMGLMALVNNSGGAHSGPLECVPVEELHAEFDVNVFGTYRLTQAALPLLRIGKPGRIINIGSFLGIATIPFSSAYCSTKHALESMTSAMQQELAPMGIGVSILGAGPVMTNFNAVVLGHVDKLKTENQGNDVYDRYYAKRMEKMVKLYDLLSGLATTSEMVAKQVRHMLTTSWLRRRYCDTYTTWCIHLFYELTPTWLSDWMVAFLLR